MIKGLFFVVAGSLGLAVCQAAEDSTGGPTGQAAASTSESTDSGAASPAAVMDIEWVLREMPGVVFAEGTDQSRARIRMHKEGNKVIGSSGCNRLTGAYELKGDQLSFGPMASTRRACPDDYMNLEKAFSDRLSNVQRWRLADGKLLLLGKEGVLLIFEPGDGR